MTQTPPSSQQGTAKAHVLTTPLFPSDEEKRRAAWLYHGYPSYAAWMASSNDFFVLRRFSRTTARCLLYQQHEIAKREERLDDIDRAVTNGTIVQWRPDSIDHDPSTKRIEIIKELVPLLHQYHNSINSFAAVKAKTTASKHHLECLRNWFINYPNAISLDEQHFKDGSSDEYHKSDLFPIISRDRSPLRMILGQWPWLRRLFHLRNRTGRFEAPMVEYMSEKGLDRATASFIIVFGLGLIFGPMWWLEYETHDHKRLGIITGFVAIFTTLIWSAAGNQRPFEVLGATAAYAAVLMVFMQSNP